MKHPDFYIGIEFFASGGFRWRCTDVGTRTITAIRLSHDDPKWFVGPPYIVAEEVFDEREMERCYINFEDAAKASAENLRASGHPGYSDTVVMTMLAARYTDPASRYPSEGLLRFDRVRSDGEILHPYAARKEEGEWVILVFLPFLEEFNHLAEAKFLELPIASKVDIRTRADRKMAAK